MAKVANLSADLVANTSTFEVDLKRADRALNSSQAQWGRALTKIDAQFGSLGDSAKGLVGEVFSLKGAFGALAGALGIGSLASMTKEAFDAVGGLGELAQQLGTTTDMLQAFRYGGSQAGVEAGDIDKAFAKLTRTIGDAASGSKTAIDAFNGLGVKILDVNGSIRPTDDIIFDISDALSRIADPAARAAIEVALFGKAGQKMDTILSGGALSIREFVQQAKDLGLVFSEDQIKNADAVSDSMAALATVLKTQLYSALIQLGPTLTEFFADIEKGIVTSKQQIQDFKDMLHSNFGISTLKDQLADVNSALAAIEGGGALANVPAGMVSPEMLKNNQMALDGLKAQKAQLESLLNVQSGQSRLHPVVGPALTFSGAGASNPLPAATGKSAAEKQAETLTKKIADLQLQVDTFDLGAIDQDIAKALEGIDQSLPGAKESVTTITDLIRQLGGLTAARETDKAAVAEYDKLITDLETARQKRLADGTALTEAVQTPTEAYKARIDELNASLASGAINQETYNRQMAAADDTYNDAAKGADVFWQAADQAGSTIASSFADAVVEGENLNDTINSLIKNLAKMALQKGFEALFSYGVGAAFGAKAVGGPAGGLTLVGERGPELVDLPAGSYVSPSMQTSGAMSQMVPNRSIGAPVGTNINQKIDVHVSGGSGDAQQNQDLADRMGRQFDAAMKRAIDERISVAKRPNGLLRSGGGWS